MTFPEIEATLRTDDDFVRQSDCGHHKSVSPFFDSFEDWNGESVCAGSNASSVSRCSEKASLFVAERST